MKSTTTLLLAVALLAAAGTIAQAQVRKEGDRTPTADITELPRSVDKLNWDPRKHDRNDSLLSGGSPGTLPENRVPLPGPPLCPPEGCDGVNPPGGGIDPAPFDPPPLITLGCECPTMAVVPGGFIPALAQFTTFEECEEERLSLRQGRPGGALLECSNYSSTPHPRACYSLHQVPELHLIEIECAFIGP